MKYEAANQGSQFPYPNHDVAPDKKKSDWCMQYARAAYWDWFFGIPKGVFASNGGDYMKYRMYALGKQPVGQYKKWLGVDQQTNDTWLTVDWSIRPIVSGYRDKAISRLMKEDYSIVATPVDALAKTKLDDYMAEVKTKLMVRQLMLKQNPELASHPLITMQTGEPLDVEELEMRVELGEQFNRSKDAEMAIELGFYENDYETWRRMIYEDLFDWGAAGYFEYLGTDNKAKFRRTNGENTIVSNSKDGTFKDIVHAGEQIDVSLIELAQVTDEDGNLVFDEKELQEFAGSIAGKMGNPASMGYNSGWLRPYDKFKCKVFEIYFFTYNDSVYMDTVDENGNSDFRKAQYGRGKKSEKYKRKKIEYVYKCKWIVGTDKCYDWGMCYDQKRTGDVKKKAKTQLPYKFFAYNFYEMKAQGYMERLIPYLDDYQLTMMKIQNFKNRSVPSGWWINLDFLENAALNKGGKNMTPMQLLQMFLETGIIAGRSLKGDGQPLPGNVQPIIPITNTAATELAMFYQDLISIISAIEKMTGYNDITSGNPNPKTLIPGYELADQSTNDALYPMAYAERWLSTRLAEDVLCRMKQGIKKGKVSGYAPYSGAIGVNTLRFMELDGDLPLRDFGIELQKKSTEQERIWIMQQVQGDIANGFLDTSDAILIINTHNAKQAMQILSFKVRRAKDKAQENELAKIQEANKGNMQSQQMAQQAKEREMQILGEIELQKKSMEVNGEIQKTAMKIESDERIAMHQDLTKLQVASDTGEAKVISTHVAGEQAKEKQIIANNKPTSSSSN